MNNKFIDNFFLVYTGIKRKSENILGDQKNRIYKNTNLLENLTKIAYQGKKLIISEKFDQVGNLLNHNWDIKKQLSEKISNNKVNTIYNNALKYGALGGKICGAGKGGYMLFYVPKDKHGMFNKKFKDNILKFQISKYGATIILNDN